MLSDGLRAAATAEDAVLLRGALDRQMDYTIHLQRIIEALCNGTPLRDDGKDGAPHHYNMAAEYLSRIAQALAAEREAERWQPIETAPKDGTEIDVWARTPSGLQRRITDVAWGEMADWDGRVFEDWSDMYPDRFGERYEPTHWMLSPRPPAAIRNRSTP